MNKLKGKLNIPIIAIAAFITTLLAVLMLTPLSAAQSGTNAISSVTVNKNKSDLVFEISLTKEYAKENKSSSVYLFELLPYHTADDINSLDPVKTLKPSEKITVKIPYYVGNRSRLYSRFALAEKGADGVYRLITDEKYVANVSSLAKNDEAFPIKSSKKGLHIKVFSDAQRLGAAHTVINVPINEYMLAENRDGAQSFIYNGQTFYVDGIKLALLDHRVKTYTEAGLNVYFNLVLTAPGDSGSGLYYEGVSSEASQYALNTDSEAGMKMFQAFVDYLAAHYTRADRAYGFVPAIIIGFEVNSNNTWSMPSEAGIEERVDSYAKIVRVAYTAMASYYSEGRVYISLGNNFCADKGDGAQYSVPAKDFLDLFAAKIKSGTDIPWGLSVNPYPSDPALVEYWNDSYAEDNFETPFITMKNIGALTRYMHEENMLFTGKVRSVIIGELGISGDPENESEMTMQAAAFALAYYTAELNEDIDAFIYHRQVDHSKESKYYGLWTAKSGTTDEPLAKKPIYNVFSLVDTESSEDIAAFAKQTLGNGVYNLYMPENVKYKQFNARTIVPAASAHSTDFDRGYKAKRLLDLTAGNLQNFYPSDSAEYVELRPSGDGGKTVLYAKVSDTPTEYNGISNTSFAPGAFEKAHYITLRIMAAAPSDAQTMNVMLRLQNDGDGENSAVVYEGEVTVQANAWTDVSFKIKDFVNKTDGDVDCLKLWVRSADSNVQSGEYGIWLEGVTLQTKGGMGVFGWILTIILILVLLIVAGYGALVLRAQYIRKKRRAIAEQRRREALRRQQMTQTQNIYRGNYMPPNDTMQ